MKLVKAFVHHVRAPEVVQALADAGYRNITLQNVMGMLKPITDSEQTFSSEAGGLVISEVRLSLVCEDADVNAVTAIIRWAARVGTQISGWVYVSPVEQALPIGGEPIDEPHLKP
ncbi:MAG TPA: P-II family nitrogen regulator [Steroidobacteraceae bacterium]|nr:P-II family nitrogen regulator [Steroidobacteraceae bacterium]